MKSIIRQSGIPKIFGNDYLLRHFWLVERNKDRDGCLLVKSLEKVGK